MKILLIALLFTNIALSKNKTDEKGKKKKSKKELKSKLINSKSIRSEKGKGIYFTYAYYDLWLPSKKGITYSQGNDERLWELAYQKSTISFDFIIDDIGSLTEQRFILATCSFNKNNSFNWTYGAYYSKFDMVLGDALLEEVSGADTSVELLSIDNIGALWGFGNRWEFMNGFSIGLDWFKLYWPLINTKNNSDFITETDDDSDADDVQNIVDILSKTPTFAVAHIEIGYRF